MDKEKLIESLKTILALLENIIVDYKKSYNRLRILRIRLERIIEELGELEEEELEEEELEEEEEEKYFEI